MIRFETEIVDDLFASRSVDFIGFLAFSIFFIRLFLPQDWRQLRNIENRHYQTRAGIAEYVYNNDQINLSLLQLWGWISTR